VRSPRSAARTPRLVVVGHAEIAIGAVGFFHEIAKTVKPLRPGADERVVRRQVEHVVLHDPRRHDQHRLGVHGRGRRRVLDQFHQPRAQHDPARRDGDVAADDEMFCADRRQIPHLAPGVFERVSEPAHEVHPAFLQRALPDDRVQRYEVRRRHQVEPLARGEAHHVLMVVADTGNAGRRAMPGPLLQQEALREPAERPSAPGRVAEALVLWHWLEWVIGCQGGGTDLHDLLDQQMSELPLLCRRGKQMNPPVKHRARSGGGRDGAIRAEAERGQLALQLAISMEGRRLPALSSKPGARAAFSRARGRDCLTAAGLGSRVREAPLGERWIGAALRRPSWLVRIGWRLFGCGLEVMGIGGHFSVYNASRSSGSRLGDPAMADVHPWGRGSFDT
jgi:hypothetical protein